MTSGAGGRRRFVEKHFLAADFPNIRVATIAFDTGMAALQRKLRPSVMIEEGRRPTLGVMAVDTRRSALFRDELPAVRIDVAAFATLCSAFELNFFAS